MEKLGLKSIIQRGKDKGRKVSDIISKDRKRVFGLIREGFQFDDEVLSAAGIKKTIREEKTVTQIVTHEKDNRVYQKDTMRLDRIISELLTVRSPYGPSERAIAAAEEEMEWHAYQDEIPSIDDEE